MRLLLYEWCCSGGLHGPDAAAVAGDDSPAGLITEGRLMLEALADDAFQLAKCEVTLLTDSLLPAASKLCLPVGVRRRKVAGGEELAALLDTARDADAVILVAPETAGVLESRLSLLHTAGIGDRVIGGPKGFVATAADKHATCGQLAAAGVPVPAGRTLEAGEQLPVGFRLPAVIKARSSAGCDGLQLLHTATDFQPPAGPARLEALVPGTPASLACLCGLGGITPLLPLEQLFDGEGMPTFRGLRPLAADLRPRAEQLAVRAVEALALGTCSRPRGWVGVDMLMGLRTDGRDDRVIEINPRLTTSFVGLRRGQAGGLVRPLLEQAAGRLVPLDPWNETSCELLLP